MIKDKQQLNKFLVGWITTVAKGLGKSSVAVLDSPTTASRLVEALAKQAELEVVRVPSFVGLGNDVLLLGAATRDNYVAARSASNRDLLLADAQPLASLHESEVAELAESVGIEASGEELALPGFTSEEVAAAVDLVATLAGSTDGRVFIQLASVLNKSGAANQRFIDVMRAVGESEARTRYRHNPNVPVPNVREPSLGMVE